MAGAPVRNATPATLTSILSAAQPGDVIELGAGTYAAFTVSRDGLPGQPIVIRDSNGDAVVNGPGGLGNGIDLTNRSHVILDGLTINNGRVKLNDTNTVAVVRCTLNASGDGIIALTRSENLYIADNRLTGQGQWVESRPRGERVQRRRGDRGHRPRPRHRAQLRQGLPRPDLAARGRRRLRPVQHRHPRTTT